MTPGIDGAFVALRNATRSLAEAQIALAVLSRALLTAPAREFAHPFVPSDRPDACEVCGRPEAEHLAEAEASPDNPYGSEAKHGHYDATSAAEVAEDVLPPERCGLLLPSGDTCERLADHKGDCDPDVWGYDAPPAGHLPEHHGGKPGCTHPGCTDHDVAEVTR